MLLLTGVDPRDAARGNAHVVVGPRLGRRDPGRPVLGVLPLVGATRDHARALPGVGVGRQPAEGGQRPRRQRLGRPHPGQEREHEQQWTPASRHPHRGDPSPCPEPPGPNPMSLRRPFGSRLACRHGDPAAGPRRGGLRRRDRTTGSAPATGRSGHARPRRTRDRLDRPVRRRPLGGAAPRQPGRGPPGLRARPPQGAPVGDHRGAGPPRARRLPARGRGRVHRRRPGPPAPPDGARRARHRRPRPRREQSHRGTRAVARPVARGRPHRALRRGGGGAARPAAAAGRGGLLRRRAGVGCTTPRWSIPSPGRSTSTRCASGSGAS